MTDAELDEIEARAKAATAGPWTGSRDLYRLEVHGELARTPILVLELPGKERDDAEEDLVPPRKGEWDQPYADAAFVIAAREDAPALVAEVRRLRAECKGVRTLVNEVVPIAEDTRATTAAAILVAEARSLRNDSDVAHKAASASLARAEKAERLAAEHEERIDLLGRRNQCLREALMLVQWGSCDGCGQKTYCPECGASTIYPGQHSPGCAVGEALAQ